MYTFLWEDNEGNKHWDIVQKCEVKHFLKEKHLLKENNSLGFIVNVFQTSPFKMLRHSYCSICGDFFIGVRNGRFPQITCKKEMCKKMHRTKRDKAYKGKYPELVKEQNKERQRKRRMKQKLFKLD